MGQHSCQSHPHPKDFSRAFQIGVLLNTVYVIVEAGVGFSIGSMALVADAAHNLSDVFSLLLAWGAASLAKRPPTPRFTFGLKSATIVAAFLNALLLLVAVVGIGWEALERFRHPASIPGLSVMVTAAVGVVVNLATAWFFIHGAAGDLNIRGAYLHMAADAAMSAAVVVVGAVIWATNWNWLDPASSIAIAGAIAWGTWGLFRESLVLILQGVPDGLDHTAVADYLRTRPGVASVDRLHIWGISTTETALAAHVVLKPLPDSQICPHDARFIEETTQGLHDQFGLQSVTLQVSHASAKPAPSLQVLNGGHSHAPGETCSGHGHSHSHPDAHEGAAR